MKEEKKNFFFGRRDDVVFSLTVDGQNVMSYYTCSTTLYGGERSAPVRTVQA